MIKKVSIILVLIIFLAVGAWYFFFHSSIPAAPGTSATQAGSPFGVIPGDVTNSGAGNPQSTFVPGSTSQQSAPTTALFKITADPVAGAVVFLKGKTELVRYVDRATGHIFELDPFAYTKTEIVNNTSPKIYDAIWKPDGSQVIVRTLREGRDDVLNTSLTLVPPKANSTSTDGLYTITAVELRGNADELVPSTNSIAYVLKDTGTVGTSGFGGQSPTTLYSSAFTNWQIAWQGANLVLTTNATANADGFSYLLRGGALTKLLGPLQALTALTNSDASRIAYSYQDGRGDTLFAVRNTKTRADGQIVPSTLAEKCTWSTKNKALIFCAAPTNLIGADEPDQWYQGYTHFSDNIWKFDTDTGTATLLSEPKKTLGADIDVIRPALSPNEDLLIFTNKTDLSLWALKLTS